MGYLVRATPSEGARSALRLLGWLVSTGVVWVHLACGHRPSPPPSDAELVAPYERPDPPPDNGPAPPGFVVLTWEDSYANSEMWPMVCPSKEGGCPQPKALPTCRDLPPVTPPERLEAMEGKVVTVVGRLLATGWMGQGLHMRECQPHEVTPGQRKVIGRYMCHHCSSAQASVHLRLSDETNIVLQVYEREESAVRTFGCVGDAQVKCCPVPVNRSGITDLDGELLPTLGDNPVAACARLRKSEGGSWVVVNPALCKLHAKARELERDEMRK